MSGLIHLYCGDGKGKTTSTIGLSVRAAGSGLKVIFCQFMKGKNTSELRILNSIEEITVLRCNNDFGFVSSMDEKTKEEAKNAYSLLMAKAIDMALELKKCLLVMDEITYAYSYGFINRKELEDFVNNKPDDTEIVFTGRNPDKFFIDHADYISEIKKIRHPYDKGITARRGIEY